MTEVTERAAAESHAAAAATVPSQPQQQQQAAGDVDGETRHRQQMQSALAALPRKNSYDDFNYDDDGYNNSGYERYSAPYASSSPIVSAANAPTSTALTLYSEEDDEPGYAHLFDSPEEDAPKASSSPSAAYYTKYKTPVKNPFTGLSNQGATCYMNSLLQTMFMTPEFRKGLYQWQFGRSTERSTASTAPAHATSSSSDGDDDDSGDDNIPFQLQKLFAKLQVSTQDSISTKALTKSFGWTGADVFQQHDVQELCRVLFDAIERSFKGTVNETLVNDLYQGALKDYVQCHTCGYESSRIDNFLDLSLVIRPFGSEEMMKSVEEAIELFLRPELLNKENQWNCDRCATKRDAIKGLKFAKLPYLLSLQLKRFDFDYATMNRIKLHNRVTFPKYLDMNSYVSDTASGRGEIARKMSMERHELEATASGRRSSVTGDADTSHRANRLSSMDETQALAFDNVTDLDDVGGVANQTQQDADATMDTWSAAFDPHEMIKRNGPHVYELYSVLIHSGSALGGHYYAYIKSFADGKWFNFNDSHVSAISDDELQTAFGGGGSSSSYSARMSYSTCAYMLMYRLVSTEKNVNVIPNESIPQYLQEKFAADEARARQAEAERIELAKKVLVRFFMKGSKPKNVEKAIHVYKTSTLGDALAAAVAAFANEPDIVIPASLANVRLRGYNDYNSMLSDTFDGKEDATLTALGIYTGQQLFIEVKSDREAWEAYDPFKLQLFVRRFVDPEQSANANDADSSDARADLLARCIQVDDNATLGALCQLVAHKFDVPSDQRVRLLTKNGYGTSPVRILTMSDDAASMNLRLRMNLHITNGTEVFMETTPDLAAPSPAKAHFEREANTIVVNFKYLSRAAEPVRIDRRETVAALKRAISAKIGLAPSQFKLLRGVNSSGVEIKTVDSTLYSLSIGANHTLFVLEGVPLNRGEYNFRLMLHRPVAPAEAEAQVETDAASSSAPSVREPAQLTVASSSAGSAIDSAVDDLRLSVDDVLLSSSKDDAAFVFAGPMVISEDMLVDAIRSRAHALLLEKQLIAPDVPASHIRLRDLRQSTMTQILVDGRKLLDASDSAVYELRGIVAQVLTEPEQAQPEHRVVEFVFVDRSTWRFRPSRRCEVVVSKGEQVARPTTYIADAASRAFGVPPERLRFARIPYHRESCDILEVVSYEFHTAEDVLTARAPDYQELLLVIDAEAPLTFMTHRERLAIQRFLAAKSEEKAKAQRAKYASVSSGSSGYVYHKPKEAALVIRTKSRSSEKEKETRRGGGSTASSTGTSGAVATEDGVTIRSSSPAAAKRATAARGASNNNNLAGSDTDDEDDDDDDAQTDTFGATSDAVGDSSSVLADLDLLDDVRASFR